MMCSLQFRIVPTTVMHQSLRLLAARKINIDLLLVMGHGTVCACIQILFDVI